MREVEVEVSHPRNTKRGHEEGARLCAGMRVWEAKVLPMTAAKQNSSAAAGSVVSYIGAPFQLRLCGVYACMCVLSLAEDTLASVFAYFEALVWYYQHEKRIRFDRIGRLQDPSKLVLVAVVFSSTGHVVPELFSTLQGRFLEEGALAKLTGSELASLAHAFAANGAGSPEFFKAVAAAAAAKGPLAPHDSTNLSWALATRGVAV